MNKSLVQILGFLTSTIGWGLVSCSMVMDYWRMVYIGGQGGSWVIKAAWYWSTLWRDCYIDSSAVANCRDFDIMWLVRPANSGERGSTHTVRGLLLFGMCLGVFAAVFCFLGMSCTYIGGREKNKDRILLLGGTLHFVGGVSCLASYSLYASRLGRAAFAYMHNQGLLRYEIGPPVFLGLVGSSCIIIGSVAYLVTLYKTFVPKRKMDEVTTGKLKASQKKVRLYTEDMEASTPDSSSSRRSSQSSIDESEHSITEDRDSFV